MEREKGKGNGEEKGEEVADALKRKRITTDTAGRTKTDDGSTCSSFLATGTIRSRSA